jgi:hypothetical protein
MDNLINWLTKLWCKISVQRKVGSLSPKIQQQVETLSIEKLETLGEALLDFNSLDDLIDWLTNNINL